MSSFGRTDICSSHRNGNITSVARMLAAVYSSARRRRSWRLRSRCAWPTVIVRLCARLLMHAHSCAIPSPPRMLISQLSRNTPITIMVAIALA